MDKFDKLFKESWQVGEIDPELQNLAYIVKINDFVHIDYNCYFSLDDIVSYFFGASQDLDKSPVSCLLIPCNKIREDLPLFLEGVKDGINIINLYIRERGRNLDWFISSDKTKVLNVLKKGFVPSYIIDKLYEIDKPTHNIS